MLIQINSRRVLTRVVVGVEFLSPFPHEFCGDPHRENLIPIPMGMGIPMGIPIPTATLVLTKDLKFTGAFHESSKRFDPPKSTKFLLIYELS